MKKQHSARPMMTLALLALMLYKLVLAPASINAETSVKNTAFQQLGTRISQAFHFAD